MARTKKTNAAADVAAKPERARSANQITPADAAALLATLPQGSIAAMVKRESEERAARELDEMRKARERAETERKEREARAKVEAERKEREAQERAETERKEREARAKADAERKERERRERLAMLEKSYVLRSAVAVALVCLREAIDAGEVEFTWGGEDRELSEFTEAFESGLADVRAELETLA